MRKLSEVINNSKKKQFNVEIEIQLEGMKKMKSQLTVNETTISFAKQEVEMILAENNIMKFDITSISEVEPEYQDESEYLDGDGDVNGLIGKRIKLIQMNDEPYPIEPGTEGVIQHIDGIGHIHVAWENGSSLSLIPGIDEYEIIG